MTLRLDHIFVCTAVGAPEAQALLDAGFVEGSRNIHPGQGTTNRRFFFEGGFLEFLWVHSETEASSALTARTRLWERWSQRGHGANPFGLCFSSSTHSKLPFAAWAYHPSYLPPDKNIYFAEGAAISEPELFALSWPQPSPVAVVQPTRHRLALGKMQTVSVGMKEVQALSPPMRAAIEAGLLTVHQSVAPELVIGFSSLSPVNFHLPSLSITLLGR